jgi:MerR family transcriptional regulator, light-induced transcriptional regulator
MSQSPQFAQFSAVPVFNTKAVVRDTGVPADTFRAWERRYGIPRPQRTAGGHRLYSERDIALIRWLRDRTDEGMNVSHAVLLLETMLGTAEVDSSNTEARTLDTLAEHIVNALTGFDAQAAERVLGEAFALYPFEDVLLGLIQPGLIEVGERWHRGEITVASEHFATEFVRRKMSSLLNVFETYAQRETVVVGCAPHELHDLGILLASLFLVRRGWHVVYLGAQVPLQALLETIRTVAPTLVCLSATTVESVPGLIECAKAVRKHFPQVHFGYGGRVFNQMPELHASITGTFLGPDARTLVDTVAALIGRSSTSGSGSAP